ncbi:steroid delta-isomerase [Aggregatimonas sangjinii]|uniref:Steroid delta-isomerase n=1 Tax=Aggregatimonas sangjinii TaxID=2583587 RepID=A0A5B7STM4_9FLAO|nr:nuclear transport factor 2 family protein [Aggregatimonas sangjinii]QCX00403.1 steroid delta-isomerase [Aggregatimonas sangjinii]
MKNILILVLSALGAGCYAQPDTEVYLLDVDRLDGKIRLMNPRNISNNEGYDNQPSFYDDFTIVYSSTRNGQTDIAQYDLKTGKTSWLIDTTVGSEYSPSRIPNSNAISAIRLDTTGHQRLYRYAISEGKSEEILKDLKVGYHLWYSPDILVTSVLVDNRMDLVISNLKDGTNYTTQKNVGRALHKIPNTELVSYVSKEDKIWKLKSLHPITGATETIMPLPERTNDICWLPDTTLLLPDGKTIHMVDPVKGASEVLYQFQEKAVHRISRMAISPDGKHLAIVSETAPATVVQKQVESFNAEDLDAFAACYSEDVAVLNFPSDTLYTGNENLWAGYKRYFENNPKTTVEVVTRIEIGNIVIDEEIVSKSGRTSRQAAIYEVNNGKIASMNFVHENKPIENASAIVDKQLEAYNARDIDAFLATYSNDIKLFRYPNRLTDEGQEALRKGYEDFFARTPDLNCEIKNRIQIGNKVIDEEYLTIKGTSYSAVAIYEIENGKISKVTFIQ